LRAFITGATGFIGGRVARRLLERGYSLTCLARTPGSAAARQLQAQGAALVQGDITDADSMREAMADADVVFHIAGWYRVGVADSTPALPTNVQGTRTVLGLAHQLSIPNTVYTSAAAALGNTRGGIVDENHRRDAPFVTEYTRTKYMAYEIAEEWAARGAPIRTVMPGGVYGPGDHSVLALFLRAFLHGRLPVVVGADSGMTLAHVEDIAEGHILAAERGRPGKYILAGSCLTYREMLSRIAQIAHRPPPLFISSWPIPVLIQLAKLANRLYPLPPTLHPETLQGMNRVTFFVTSARAQKELGWQSRPLEQGLAETVAWELENHS
jgi:dihydroflavonol-4-reductase